MPPFPAVLLITTQTWLQVTRMALRLLDYGAELSTISPEESHLTVLPQVRKAYRFQVGRPLVSLHRAITASHADYLLPADDLSVLLLHELWEEQPELRPLIERSLGDSGSYALLRSRPQLLQLAGSLGIRTPLTAVVRHERDLSEWSDQERVPAVLKRDCTWGGNGVRIVETREELQRAYADLQKSPSRAERTLRWLRSGDGTAFVKLRSDAESQITVQEYIEGTPANAMFACHHGRVLSSVQARVLASIGPTGPSLIVRTLQDPRICLAGSRLAEALGLSGFFGLDFILERGTDTPYLLELNPRFTRLGHLGMGGSEELAGALWQAWTGASHSRAGVLTPGEAVAFYPDGHRLLACERGGCTCSVDVQGEESAAVDALLRAYDRKQARPRRRAWMWLANRKKKLRGESETAVFFHEPLDAPEGHSLLSTAGTARAAS